MSSHMASASMADLTVTWPKRWPRHSTSTSWPSTTEGMAEALASAVSFVTMTTRCLTLPLHSIGSKAQTADDLPTFLLGHSNGGLVALKYILSGKRELRGLILSNPALKLLAVVPFWKRLMGAILLRVAPGITLDTSIPDEDLTADPLALAAIASDPLRHDRISPPLFFGMLDAGRLTIGRAGEIQLPTLMIVGGADSLIDPNVNRSFFDNLGSTDKTFEFYPEMKHEPLQEQGREAVILKIAQWVGDRLI